MSKHKTKEEWINWFKKYDRNDFNWEEYYTTINFNFDSKSSNTWRRSINYKKTQARNRFIDRYKQWKILDNTFMSKKIKKRKTNKEIDNFIDNLTEEEKKIIIREHIKRNEKEKDKSQYDGLSITKVAFVKNLHRTTLYKKPKKRKYVFDWAKEIVEETFIENHCIYGSKRLSKVLESKGVIINDRTLRRYMNRWNLQTKTRKARKKSESKNTKVEYIDLVERNFNPTEDNIVATDVSYIPARVRNNNIYLSVAISHKTKFIESWHLSTHNDNQLVIDTFNKLKRKKRFIMHSDHGSQYSSKSVKSSSKIKYSISMGRIGNSLDNREVEYFFGCLKGEYLKGLKTWKMSFEEIHKHIEWYIKWYNTKRIQKRLHWKTPASASVYAI